MYRVARDNARVWNKACRAAQAMYVDIQDSYESIGHNIDYEAIEIERYLFVSSKSLEFQDIVTLLHQGSFIALCCRVYDRLSDEQTDPKLLLFLEESLSHQAEFFSDLESNLLKECIIALKGEPRADWELAPLGWSIVLQMKQIYELYVLKNFEV